MSVHHELACITISILLLLTLLAAQTTSEGQPALRGRRPLGPDSDSAGTPSLYGPQTPAHPRCHSAYPTPTLRRGRRSGPFTKDLLQEDVRRLLARGPTYPSIPLPTGLFQLIRTGTFSPRDGPPKVRPSFRPPRPNPRENTSTQEPKRVLVTLS